MHHIVVLHCRLQHREAQYSLLEQNAWNYDKKLKSNELFVAPLQIARRKNSETQQLQRGRRFICTAEKGAWLGLKLTALWYLAQTHHSICKANLEALAVN